MTITHDISELVRRAQKGDRQSLGVLSARVRRRIFIYLYRMTLDYHLSEDLVQETVLYMIESLPRLKTTSSLSLWAWIYRSAWGIFQHYLRPQGHQRIVQKTVVDHEVLLQLTDDAKESALERAERVELCEAICKSLGMLQTRHRNVLVLRCFELLSYAEIASVMECSELKARVLFFHAKRALKRQLHKRGFGRRYFLTSLSLYGLITGMHAKSASTAVTVTSSLSKSGAAATTIGAITTKLGLLKTAVITIGLVVGTLHVCSSDAEMPTESTINIVTAGAESVLSTAEKMGNTEIADLFSKKDSADPVLPDPCGVEPPEPEAVLPAGPYGGSWPAMPASTAEPADQVDRLADPNEIRTRVESFDGLAEALRDVGAKSASEKRHWTQTKQKNMQSGGRRRRYWR
ncbi:MAG: RNA polymerase sigma factor [Phycisphaerales bacterium]|nr:MAG: RNA polymerase sigma factor [Phycisphaerales bacterium]